MPATDQVLQDLAQHAFNVPGSHDDFAGTGAQEDPNGDTSLDYLFEDDEEEAYPVTGLENSLDLEDPAALLESLANFSHEQPPHIETRPAVSTDQFESLLQAAATAGEAALEEHSQVGGSYTPFDQSDTHEYFKRSFDPPGTDPKPPKRKRGQDNGRESEERDDSDMLFRAPSKRRRRELQPEDEDQLAREREIWGPEEGEEGHNASMFERHLSPVSTADARAVGLHSATALFRRPTAASKKYTRAPMSKLFTSLELTAEHFLHLQAAAKAYMLDERYPERSDCVGNRGRGDTDMVKLKLFGCVKAFLEDEGWGDRCFSEQSDGGEFRKLKWPQMKNKIISLVTPLMRRMVTNERQRLYALETRQEKRVSKAPSVKRGRTSDSPAEVTPTPQPERRRPESVTPTPTSYGVIDPKLDEYHYNIEPCFRTNGETHSDPLVVETLARSVDQSDAKYHVNIVQYGRRIQPQVTLTPTSCPGYASLVQHIHNLMEGGAGGYGLHSIKVLGPTGMIGVKDENSWRGAIASIHETEWMDGEMKVVAQVIDKDS